MRGMHRCQARRSLRGRQAPSRMSPRVRPNSRAHAELACPCARATRLPLGLIRTVACGTVAGLVLLSRASKASARPCRIHTRLALTQWYTWIHRVFSLPDALAWPDTGKREPLGSAKRGGGAAGSPSPPQPRLTQSGAGPTKALLTCWTQRDGVHQSVNQCATEAIKLVGHGRDSYRVRHDMGHGRDVHGRD